ncbi:hypothetical protein GCM10010873_32500 [Cypionkella aquatica]|uniref:Uncharacterized protein n=1 Tax=Cypionkella aquatica TaxID=1756042 RepID=A0AA37U488_9RHOB|nr:hypothetical protein [Cypionkella aquatica]GLS88276.1 hypothetical protein GCM10010873_32500 [Cypionkella aquatica]
MTAADLPSEPALCKLTVYDAKVINGHLWRINDLCKAAQVILGHNLVAAEDHPASRGLDGILSAIELSADEANVLIIEHI